MKNYKKPEIQISMIETQPIASAGIAGWLENHPEYDGVITVYALTTES